MDSFRIFDELDGFLSLNMKDALNLHHLQTKLIRLKPNNAMEMFQKHLLSFDLAKEITSYLYGKKDQLNAIKFLLRIWFHEKDFRWHLIDDWILLDIEVFLDRQIF